MLPNLKSLNGRGYIGTLKNRYRAIGGGSRRRSALKYDQLEFQNEGRTSEEAEWRQVCIPRNNAFPLLFKLAIPWAISSQRAYSDV